jgi:hypothetical protein
VTPMRLRLSLALLVILLVPAASAWASGRDVLRDCADDEVLSKAYTQKEYRDALSELATDSSEYSDCESVIRRAQLEQAADRRAPPARRPRRRTRRRHRPPPRAAPIRSRR